MITTIDVILELTDRIRLLENDTKMSIPDALWFNKKRHERQLKMRELATLSNTSLSLISRLEAGKDVGYHAVMRVFNVLSDQKGQ